MSPFQVILAACAAHAARHCGVITRGEALALGLTPRQIDRLVAARKWVVLYRGVYSPAGVPSSWHRSLMAAARHCGPTAAASHRSGAALYGLEGFDPGIVEITTNRRIRAAGIIVHRHKLEASEIRSVGGLPVTRIERTLIDLGGVSTPLQVEIALDCALRKGMTSLRKIEHQLEHLIARGRNGAGVMGSLLAERDPRIAPSESALEVRLRRALKRACLPQPIAQYRIVLEGRRFRLDFGYPDEKVAIEAQSYKHHSDPNDWNNDVDKIGLLLAAGWKIIWVTDRDLRSRPQHKMNKIRSALGL